MAKFNRSRMLILPALTGIFIQGVVTQADDAPLVDSYLAQGQLVTAENALNNALKDNPKDSQAQFSLGVVQFLRAIEGLAQSHYKHGLLQHRLQMIPLLRLPVPLNKKPEELTYDKARATIKQFSNDLKSAEETLSKVDTTNVKLPLHFGWIRLDLDGNGEATAQEALWSIYARFNRRVNEQNGKEFLITFDGGDVHWMRGYCHLLMTFCDFTLAHNWKELFDRTGHLFYPQVKTPYTFLVEERKTEFRGFNFREIADLIAFVHLINFPVAEPDRMASALGHLEEMVVLSRASWKLILAETDDDHEWLPNPKQTGVIPNVRVTEEMISGWHEFLTEADLILKGKKLLPFWRGPRRVANEEAKSVKGVNLRRVFTEPRQFDLVLWISGTAATPYLEEGELTAPEVWTRLMRVFQGEFIGFAIWFN